MGLILKGGLLMLPIIVCGLVATYIIIERIVFYKNIRKNDEILKKNIDSALLRKGRLISKYEFKPLCTEKTNALLAELYSFGEDEELPNKPLTLADIYHYKEKAYQDDRKKII